MFNGTNVIITANTIANEIFYGKMFYRYTRKVDERTH